MVNFTSCGPLSEIIDEMDDDCTCLRRKGYFIKCFMVFLASGER